MRKEKPDGFDAIGTVPVCGTCGSERVLAVAGACFNRQSGLWEIETVFDRALCQECDERTDLIWLRPDTNPNGRIRDLNDAFRTRGVGRGTYLVTSGVTERGEEFVAKAVAAIRSFDSFSKDNDPWGEHDFGAVEIEDEKIFWKIDAYDLDLKWGSPNPANPAVTHRVLTVMLASEY